MEIPLPIYNIPFTIEYPAMIALSEEQKKKILSSVDFVEFVDHSTRLVGRVLSDDYDFMKDYSITQEDDQ